MPRYRLYINGADAFTTYGLSMAPGAIAQLMAPPSCKELVSNESPLEDGKRVVVSPRKYEERTLTLDCNIIGTSTEDLLAKYNAFCTVLKSGEITISTSFQSGVVYHCLYQSTQSFSQWSGEIGKFVLKLIEPNPANRT